MGPSLPSLDDVSLLDGLKIASPCPVDWETMTGGDRVRFCGSCRKNVYNLSSMTRREAEALLREADDICVNFFQRPDGTVMTSDCPVGVSRKRRRLAVFGTLGGSLLAGAAALAAAGATETRGGSVMGDAPRVRMAASLAEDPPEAVLEPVTAPPQPPPPVHPIPYRPGGAPPRRLGGAPPRPHPPDGRPPFSDLDSF